MPESDPFSRLTRSPRALAGVGGGLLLVAVVVVLVLVLSGGSKSGPSPNQVIQPSVTHVGTLQLPPADPHRDNLPTIFTSGASILSNPAGEIATLHALGVNRVRITLPWGAVAPDPTSRRAPRFDATDPAAYPASGWTVYDKIVRLLGADHMGIDLTVGPNPPLWASGSGAPAPAADHPYWEPNAQMFGAFMRAIGTRYSGHFTPRGSRKPLPRVSFWSIWNEPNNGVQLAPQTIDHNTVESSPRSYRALAGAAWTALHQTGHGHDTILIGELAPTGGTAADKPGNFAVMDPLIFLRALYCVGSDYAPLRGAAASVRGCPATAAASKQFAAENPALFHATAFADHPYPYGAAPDAITPDGSQDAELGELPQFFTALDRLQRAYGSHRRYGVYDDEFGYITTPPGTQSGIVSPAKAARWINWSEYISWRLPRLLSYDQYLLFDPAPVPHKPYTGFASGLATYTAKLKPAFAAFRMPIWLPVTSGHSGASLEVWGCVRPAKLVAAARRAPAQIQFRPASGGSWRTLETVSVRTRYGYFDVAVRFPRSGTVRIRWAPPSGQAITSRTTPVSIS